MVKLLNEFIVSLVEALGFFDTILRIMVFHIIWVFLLRLDIIFVLTDIILFLISEIVGRNLSQITLLGLIFFAILFIVVLWHLLLELVLLAVRWLVGPCHHTSLLWDRGYLVYRLRRSLNGPAKVRFHMARGAVDRSSVILLVPFVLSVILVHTLMLVHISEIVILKIIVLRRCILLLCLKSILTGRTASWVWILLVVLILIPVLLVLICVSLLHRYLQFF